MILDSAQRPGQIVFTNKARCRDCYRCVRVCPVKAIRMVGGQAFVVEERCIACGTCIRECPQGAKSFRNDLERAARLLRKADWVAASIAPSFAALFSEWERRRLPSALRQLGFSYVGETSIGAYPVAQLTVELARQEKERTHICTACPAVVNYVERYMPHLCSHLSPVVSPMMAHARALKDQRGKEARVIFIGPCVAKKAEAERPESAGLVDCALTFVELFEWLEREGISLAECEESSFDEEPAGDARFFPLVGGLSRTASLTTDTLATEVLAVSGFEDVREAIECIGKNQKAFLIEPLFCSQGCINGPAMPIERNIYARRDDALDYARCHPSRAAALESGIARLTEGFSSRAVETERRVSEEAIRRILDQTGKGLPEDQLNCGACGYSTCRENAIAVLEQLAEPEMCIPYMRRLAEQRTDRIIETSPNGIVILDERLQILSMNPAFRRYFMCSEAICGKRISYLMDPEPFERLASGTEELIELTVRHDRYNLICHELFYPLREEKQYVGIFVNITRSVANQKKLEEMRSQTILQARELLEHQVQMAQEIARQLGQSTARGEELVRNLLRLTCEKSNDSGKDWLWDIFTSK